jgi:hypothetical protein
MRSNTQWVCLVLTMAVLVTGCQNKAKISEEKAQINANRVAELVVKDCDVIKKGLPVMAKRLPEFLFKEGETISTGEVAGALHKARDRTKEMDWSAATFYTLTDMKGKAFASSLKVDDIGGKDVFAAFPAMKKATEGNYIEGLGTLDAARGVRKGEDAQWVAGLPVKNLKGETKAVLVAGWSWRRYTYHLEEALRSELKDDLKKSKDSHAQLPLVYVFSLVDTKAYSALVTPDVSVKAIQDMNALSKMGAGDSSHGRITIDGREFGYGAKRIKNLCDKCGILVLRSEL